MIFNLAATGTAGFPEGRGKVWPAAPNLIGGVTASQSAEAGTAGAASCRHLASGVAALSLSVAIGLVLHVCRPVIHLNDLAGHDGTRPEHSGLVQVLAPDRVYRAVVNARHDVGVNDRLHASDVHDAVDVPYVLGVLDVVISGDVMHLRHGIVSVDCIHPRSRHVAAHLDGLAVYYRPCRQRFRPCRMLGLVKGLSPVVNAGDPILVDHRLDSGHGHNAIDVHHRVWPVDVPVARHMLYVAHGVVVVGRVHLGADDGRFVTKGNNGNLGWKGI